MKNLFSIFILFISLICFGQDGWETKEFESYAISYPSTWELNESGQMQTKFILFAPIHMEGDQFRENINLIVQDVSAYNLNLSDFVKISEQQVLSTFGPIELSERVGNMHKIIYEGTMSNLELKLIQYLMVEGNNAYVLTFTSEQTEFDRYEKIAVDIMDTFKLN